MQFNWIAKTSLWLRQNKWSPMRFHIWLTRHIYPSRKTKQDHFARMRAHRKDASRLHNVCSTPAICLLKVFSPQRIMTWPPLRQRQLWDILYRRFFFLMYFLNMREIYKFSSWQAFKDIPLQFLYIEI